MQTDYPFEGGRLIVQRMPMAATTFTGFFESSGNDTVRSDSAEYTWPGPDQVWFGFPDDQNEIIPPYMPPDSSDWIG